MTLLQGYAQTERFSYSQLHLQTSRSKRLQRQWPLIQVHLPSKITAAQLVQKVVGWRWAVHTDEQYLERRPSTPYLNVTSSTMPYVSNTLLLQADN